MVSFNVALFHLIPYITSFQYHQILSSIINGVEILNFIFKIINGEQSLYVTLIIYMLYIYIYSRI